MEVTTSAEALRRQRAAVGGSATTRAAARANAEQAPKPAMRKPTRLPHGEGSQRPGSERREHRPFPPGYWRRHAWKRGKEAPGFRFYSLSDKVWRDDVLAVAWQAVRRNGGAAGVDGETVADIESFGVDRSLGALARDLKEGIYRPQAVRQVLIPKKQRGTFRPLGIPCLRDRVAQAAAMLVLSPIFEADLPPEQYAYRPGRRAHDAVRRVHRLLTTGHREVVDADLSDYFGQKPHAELMKSIARRFEAEIVNYADDFAVLGRAPAAVMLAAVEGLMKRLKLPMNAEKTRCCRVPEESMTFLGYRIGRNYAPDTGEAYVGPRPSPESVRSICRRVSALTTPRDGLLSAGVVVARLNRVLTGWANYFTLRQVSPAYRAVDQHARRRLRQWLYRKHKVRFGKYVRFPNERLWQEYGLTRLAP